jgi:hypothetical protein
MARTPVHLPPPEPEQEIPPAVAQALDDYLVALLLADLEADATLQNQVLTAQTAQGYDTSQICRPSGHPGQGADRQEAVHGEAEG